MGIHLAQVNGIGVVPQCCCCALCAGQSMSHNRLAKFIKMSWFYGSAVVLI
jgi:hypothetical protein